MPGAHCKEAGMNGRSIGICVVGNFELAPPDLVMLKALRDICFAVMVNHGIPAQNVIGHRDAGLMAGFDWRKGQYKTCPGRLFPMDALRSLLSGAIA
jgi:N-acetyl-anhydromuramyl-L-alanine amidase AmpD